MTRHQQCQVMQLEKLYQNNTHQPTIACIRKNRFSAKSKVCTINKSQSQTERELLFNPLLHLHANHCRKPYLQKMLILIRSTLTKFPDTIGQQLILIIKTNISKKTCHRTEKIFSYNTLRTFAFAIQPTSLTHKHIQKSANAKALSNAVFHLRQIFIQNLYYAG